MSPQSNSEPQRRSWPRRMLNRMEIDRAVFYALTARAWQFAAGPVTLLLIAFYFTPELQGYYYTFWSLLALQAFVELGLQLVIVYVASHEWAELRIDTDGVITGDEKPLSRLASLARLVLKWFSVASVLFVVGVGGGGAAFFSRQSADVSWLSPWLALVLLTSLSLWLSPFVALLEGCNQVAVVNFYRTVQAVTANAAVWICIPLGAGLWTPVAAAAVRLLCEVYLIGVRYRHFWRRLLKPPNVTEIEWKAEVWPLQWRQAVQSVLGYFTFHLMTPVMFHYHGAAVAGRMGMTWTIVISLQTAAFAWVQTRTPLFGMLIAKQDYRELDRVFLRVTSISLLVLIVAGTAFGGFVVLINSLENALAGKLAARLLPAAPSLLLVLGVTLQQVAKCQNIYVRAHKRDPFLILSCVVHLLTGMSIWLLGRQFGPIGAASAFLAVIALVQVPGWTWIWRRARSEWHRSADDSIAESC